MLQRIRAAVGRDPRLSRIFHGSASALLSRGFALLMSAVSLPLTVRYLGPERYGIWVTVSTTVVMMSVLDLGIANSLTNLISRAYAGDDKLAAQRSYASAFWVSSGASAVFGMIAWAFWKKVPWQLLFHVSRASLAREAEVCVAIAIAFFLLSLPLNLVNRVLSGYQQTQVTNYASLLNSVLGLMAILLVIGMHGSLVDLMVAYSAMMLVGTLGLNVWVLFWNKRWMVPVPQAIHRSTVRELLGSGTGYLLLQLSALVVFNSDNLVIGHYLSAADVTPYSVTWRLVGYAAVLQTALSPALWPAYSEAYARGDYGWVRKTFWRSGRVALGVTVAATLVLTLFGRPLIRWYVGPAAVPSEILIIAICGWTVLSTGMEVESCLLCALDRVKLQSALSLVAAVVNITLSIYWVQRIGSVGVVLGTMVSYLIILVGPQTVLVWRALYRPETEG